MPINDATTYNVIFIRIFITMQRFFAACLIFIIALYISPHAFSTHLEDHISNYDETASTPSLVPHVALLLPLQSSSFGQAADVVRQGFAAAATREQALPIATRIYSTTDDPLDILITYHQALDAGAILVVGPLTRDGVSALASSSVIAVPTLTLNTADGDIMVPPNLYLFGLQMENEASLSAEFARAENKSHAVIIHDGSPLSLRLQAAFADKWLQSDAHATAESIPYYNEPSVLKQFRRQTADKDTVIFLTLDAKKSRILRPYLNPGTPVYATSQVYTGQDNSLYNHDLNDIRFVDMPWLLQPDHPAVMAYRHADNLESMDMERLYALGIDAFRLMARMLQAYTVDEISLDGVTGYIYFRPPNQFIREAIPARFDNGRVFRLNSQ